MIKSPQALMGVFRRTAERAKITLTTAIAVIDARGTAHKIHDVVWNSEKRRWEIRVTEE